jgi:hypothetical protein
VANFVNLTPHAIVLNDGRLFPPSGEVARVSSSHSDFDADGIASVVFGEVSGLHDPLPDTFFIVSGLVAAAVKRPDVVSPASGHPDTVRDKGQIVSVPGFIRG